MKKIITLSIALYALCANAAPTIEEFKPIGMVSQIHAPQSEPTSYEIKISAADNCGRFAIASSEPVLIIQKDTSRELKSPSLSVINKYETRRLRLVKFADDDCTITIIPVRKDKMTFIVFTSGGRGVPFPESSDAMLKKLDSSLEELRKSYPQPAG